GCIRLSATSTTIWCVGLGGNTSGCTATPGGRGSSWRASPDGSRGCSLTGGGCGREAGDWEPCEPRGSRTVLREAGGATRPVYSPRGGVPGLRRRAAVSAGNGGAPEGLRAEGRAGEDGSAALRRQPPEGSGAAHGQAGQLHLPGVHPLPDEN